MASSAPEAAPGEGKKETPRHRYAPSLREAGPARHAALLELDTIADLRPRGEEREGAERRGATNIVRSRSPERH
jgi:hypothetical protein